MMLCCFKSQAAILLLNSLEKTPPTSQKDPEPYPPPHLTPLACPSLRPDAQDVSYGKNFFQVKHFQSQPHFL